MTGARDVRRAAGFAPRPPALQVKCPHCQAPEGEPCTTPSGRHPLREPHPGRVAAGPDAQVIPLQPTSREANR